MKTALLGLLLIVFASDAAAACAEKRSREPSFIELAVPEGSIRPKGVADFGFITDETTVDDLVAKVGPPDAAQGTRAISLIWCFADGTELVVITPDRAVIETVRHKGRDIFRHGKKKK